MWDLTVEVLPRLYSWRVRIVLHCHHDVALKNIGECVGRSTLKRLQLLSDSPSFQSKEALRKWVQSVVVGGNSLIRSLEYSQVAVLVISIYFRNVLCPIDTIKDGVQAQLCSLQETATFVSLEREKKSIPSLDLNISCYQI